MASVSFQVPRIPTRSARRKPYSFSFPGLYPPSYNPTISKQRLVQLSKPKEVKNPWVSQDRLNVMWGTQEMMKPIPSAALKGGVPERLGSLAQPKRSHMDPTSSNRWLVSDSVEWEVSKSALSHVASERIIALATPKPREELPYRHIHVFSCGRSSPIWEVKKGRSKGDMAHIGSLSKHKDVPKEFQSNRETPASVIQPAALKANASARIESLASAKNRADGPYRDPKWHVSASAKKAQPSPRIGELAKCKLVADGYQPERKVIWQVPASAKRAVATTRTSELATPVTRQDMERIKFNPDAFKVKPEALNARCSGRIDELAQPIQR